VSHVEQSHAGHGCLKHSRCWTSGDKKLIDALGTDRAGLSSIVVIESDCRMGRKPDMSDRPWYISSRAGTAGCFLTERCTHWEIENGLYCVLRAAFREDESRVSRKDGAENVPVIRRMR